MIVANLFEALNKVLISPQGGENFKACIPQLKKALSDKGSDVRKEAYDLVANCLQFFTYSDLRQNESTLTLLLLHGLSDPKPELRQHVQEQFDICGRSRQRLEEKMAAEAVDS